MKQQIDLLHGNIFSSLTKLALPIMATALIQMAYNMIDMIWIGRVGSNAVAAVGAAGMYMWMASGFSTLAKMGGQVRVGQALGAGKTKEAVTYARHALQLGIILGILYGFISIVFAKPLIGFFNLNSQEVIKDAQIYLIVVCGTIVFAFVNQILTGIFTALGNSKTPLIATMVGLIINIILDPVFIFGWGFIPKMGVLGASLATALAQAIVTIVFLMYMKKDTILFHQVKLKEKINGIYIKNICIIGIPTAIQSLIFTGISMVIARMIAGWGDFAVAVQKVGSQIESISWMTAEGFAAAVNSFVAQNYGARNLKRVKKGYLTAMIVVIVWGIFCSWLLIFQPEFVFRIFIPEEDVLEMGVDYLRILGYSQLFMCIEITTNGAFSGMGKTIPPAISSTLLTLARIPMALVLSQTILGLNGIWWSISISSALKGVVIFTCFLFVFLVHRQDQTRQDHSM